VDVALVGFCGAWGKLAANLRVPAPAWSARFRSGSFAILRRDVYGAPFRRLQGAQKCDKVLFLLRRQLCAEDQVEELDCIVQRQQALVM
jgi:hypothetical protein